MKKYTLLLVLSAIIVAGNAESQQLSVQQMVNNALKNTQPSPAAPQKVPSSQPQPVQNADKVAQQVAPTIVQSNTMKTTEVAPVDVQQKTTIPETLQSLPAQIEAPVLDVEKNASSNDQVQLTTEKKDSNKRDIQFIPIGDEIPKKVRENLSNDFQNELTFQLTEPKMVAYTRTSRKVEQVTRRWDVEIAVAETDQIAVENNNFALEDIQQSISNIHGLSEQEYLELAALTAKNKKFARLVKTYQDYIDRGIFGTSEKPIEYVEMQKPITIDQQQQTGDLSNKLSELEAKISTIVQSLEVNNTDQSLSIENDPVLSAQLEAMTAKIKIITEKLEKIDQRADQLENKLK